MSTSDLDQLLAMGFEQERAELAVKKTGGIQGAIDWLDKNQDKTVEQIKQEEDAAAEPPALQHGEEARSLVCDDCGKRFRSTAQAEFHATKTQHENFSESTEEIKPLTEAEKKAKLEELKAKMAEKRARQEEQDRIDRRKNEQIRMKATKESQDMKEALEKKERLKEAKAKKQEKQNEIDARKRALAKIEADKAERKRKADLEKAARAGQAPPVVVEEKHATSSGPTTSKPASAYTEARLALQTSSGRIMKNFPAETTLFEVAHALSEQGIEVETFTQTFPRKVFDRTDFGQTLKEAGMVPSAALIVK
ncbi:putative UBX domain protein [Lepidopterella palustris CBS 459.81]|uniref:Putative UBX domain protein n=1 Tax=Lepidopterella palustris CBS 459.81 TaxID=1314670 RepID=A0A8E2JCR8_9PEZI|nr:putative UBX domain protein [Lepidopterella palustris CBS 459.81]